MLLKQKQDQVPFCDELIGGGGHAANAGRKLGNDPGDPLATRLVARLATSHLSKSTLQVWRQREATIIHSLNSHRVSYLQTTATCMPVSSLPGNDWTV